MEKIKDGGDSFFRDISRTSVKQSVPDLPITVIHLNSSIYVELDGEFIETPFQHFEEVSQDVEVTKVVSQVPKITRPPLKMSSLKDAKAVIEEGGCTIWGQLPNITYKSDKFGLGFTSGAQEVVRHARAGGPPPKISNREINAVEEDRKSVV